MTRYASTFSAVGVSSSLSIGSNESIDLVLSSSDWSGAQAVKLERAVGSGAWEEVASYSANFTGTIENPGAGLYRLRCSVYTATITYVLADHNDLLAQYTSQDGIRAFAVSEEGVLLAGDTNNETDIGLLNAVSGLSATIRKVGNFVEFNFTLSSVAMTHTDAAGSGSFASVKLFDFIACGFQALGSVRNLSFLGDALIDTNVGDMAFVHGIGSVTANAGDGALTSTEVDIGAVSGTVTLSSKAATSVVTSGVGAAVVDGIGGAKDIWFNTSGTAATSDANGVLTVSGTIRILGILLKS